MCDYYTECAAMCDYYTECAAMCDYYTELSDKIFSINFICVFLVKNIEEEFASILAAGSEMASQNVLKKNVTPPSQRHSTLNVTLFVYHNKTNTVRRGQSRPS
jgi:hypothetical protein